jgi:hypothetical protein
MSNKIPDAVGGRGAGQKSQSAGPGLGLFALTCSMVHVWPAPQGNGVGKNKPDHVQLAPERQRRGPCQPGGNAPGARRHGFEPAFLTPVLLRLVLSRRGGVPLAHSSGRMFPYRPPSLAARALPHRETPAPRHEKCEKCGQALKGRPKGWVAPSGLGLFRTIPPGGVAPVWPIPPPWG